MNNPLATEIAALRSQLSRYHQEKESWFQKAQALQQQLKERIHNLKQQLQDSRESTHQIAALRKSRDAANQEVKLLVQKIKTLRESRKALLSKHPSKFAASCILHHMESLELKVETEALTPEQETRMMKKIHALKKQYGSQKEILATFSQIKLLSKAIAEKRKIANQHHGQLQAAIAEKNSPAFLQQSKEILELRSQQEATFQKFIAAKQKSLALNRQLKEKFSLLNAERKVLAENKKLHEFRKRQRNEDILKEKEREVEEKLRTKKHLTHEDLLVFQKG